MTTLSSRSVSYKLCPAMAIALNLEKDANLICLHDEWSSC